MGREKKTVGSDNCTHCHLCRKNCRFLEKYNLDIGDTEKLRELAYHCFLCGKCTQICPQGIDGREIILNMRREQVRGNGGKLHEKGYAPLLWEKGRYKFKNYRNLTPKTVLFPGCNFPSFYPDTTKYLINLVREEIGAGVIFDCCGKPIAELGLADREAAIIKELNDRLNAEHIEEIIMVCPNCYAFLKPRLEVKVVSIYEKLADIGIGERLEGEVRMFLPCPDRENQEILEHIKSFLKEKPKLITDVQCCGLGGCAAIKEPDLARNMLGNVGKEEKIYTYCATCAGNFARQGYADTTHILVNILGTKEKPDTEKSLLNRMKTKYWRGKTDEKAK